jgi:hypothetical protein
VSHLAPSTDVGAKIPDGYRLEQKTVRSLLAL